MKKTKNIILLSGLICNSVIISWFLFKFVMQLFDTESGSSLFLYSFYSALLPLIEILILTVAPLLLFIRNLKNKTGKVLPIISLTTNGAVLSFAVLFMLTPTILIYLIYSKLGIIDTYFLSVRGSLLEAKELFVSGCLLLITGSILSLFKKEQQ